MFPLGGLSLFGPQPVRAELPQAHWVPELSGATASRPPVWKGWSRATWYFHVQPSGEEEFHLIDSWKKDEQAEVTRNKFELSRRKNVLILASREGLGKMVGGLPVIWEVCSRHHRVISTERTGGGVGQHSSSYSTFWVETWWILEGQTFCYWCGVTHLALGFSCWDDGSSSTTEER